MGIGELKILTEGDNYFDFVKCGKPVALLKVRKNADNTYSNFVELFNCTDEHKLFMCGALKQATNCRVGDCFAKG